MLLCLAEVVDERNMPESGRLGLARAGGRLRLEGPELQPRVAEEDRLVVRRRRVPLREPEDVAVPRD